MDKPKDIHKRLDALLGRTAPRPGEVQAEIEDLRRQIAGGRREAAGMDDGRIVYRRDLPRTAGPVAAPFVPAGPPVALHEAVAGEEVHAA